MCSSLFGLLVFALVTCLRVYLCTWVSNLFRDCSCYLRVFRVLRGPSFVFLMLIKQVWSLFPSFTPRCSFVAGFCSGFHMFINVCRFCFPVLGIPMHVSPHPLARRFLMNFVPHLSCHVGVAIVLVTAFIRTRVWFSFLPHIS